MPTTRITYEGLPSAVREAVEKHTGPVITAESSTEGFNSAVASRLRTAAAAYFVRALPADHRWAWTQRREADMAPHVRSVAARLVTRVEVAGWDTVVFEALDGHHADYQPGSADLTKVATLLARIAELPCPDIELRDARQRLRRYVARGEDLAYFGGGALLHTDWNNANVIVADQARIVDWGWATRGAPWLDAAYWTIWLIVAGHDPEAAESWARHVPVWNDAPDEGVTAFAVANAAMWEEVGDGDPDPWTARMVVAARQWCDFRNG